MPPKSPKLKRRKRARILQKKEELSEDSYDLNSLEISPLPLGSISNAELGAAQINSPPPKSINYSFSISRRMKPVPFSIALFFILFLPFICVQGQPPPLPPAGFIDFDNLPVTRFSCEGKVIGGYYADVETGCQMFHVCTLGQKDEVQDIKFLCLNGTVFDQETRVCERVDEVDCSKAEQFYDLNLDLYVPHVATPKPPEPEPDLEEENAFNHPVSTPKPQTTTTTRTTIRTTTTTTTPKPVTTTTTTKSPPGTKSFSSFNYYLKTPHSHVQSGYNSQSQESYVITHNSHPEKGSSSYSLRESEAEADSEAQTQTQNGRKIPSGPKTIVYTVTSSSTAKPLITRTTTRATTTTQRPVIIRPEEYEEQYTDEYYDDELPEYEQSLPSSTGSSNANNNNNYQHQHYDYRDGRSKSDRGGRESIRSSQPQPSKSVSIAISSSKSTRSPPIVVTQSQIKSLPLSSRSRAIHSPPRAVSTTTTRRPPTTVKPTTTTQEPEPYYYDDDYPDDSELQLAEQEERERGQRHDTPSSHSQRPMIIVKPASSTTQRNLNHNNDPTSKPSEQYYDEEGEGNEPLNDSDHHFSHVDVPRIPFAKPNVPRVLVTNGKPFLPRLTRHVKHQLGQGHSQTIWDRFLESEAHFPARRK